MGIELTITCNRLGAIELLEETGTQFEMLWQPIILAVSHAQRPPRQRLSSNAAGSGSVCWTRFGAENQIPVAMPTLDYLSSTELRISRL
jgi:hypothetical protein